MTAGSLLLGLAVLALVLLFLARPFVQRSPAKSAARTERQRLFAQKEAMLTQIQTLAFDFETSKVPESVYEQQRAEMVAEAAVLMEQLDNLPKDETLDTEIEAPILQLREGSVSAPGSTNGHGRTCSECGTAVDLTDKFCAGCGHKLSAIAHSSVTDSV